MNNSEKESPKAPRKHCHHEKHLRGVALKIYNLLYRVGKTSDDAWTVWTVGRIARHIGHRSRAGVKRESAYVGDKIQEMLRDKWLEGGRAKGKLGTWCGYRLRARSHDAWSELMEVELGHSPCDIESPWRHISPVARPKKIRNASSSENWIGETEDYETVDGGLGTRRIAPGQLLNELITENANFLEFLRTRGREKASCLGKDLLDRSSEVTPVLLAAARLTFLFCWQVRTANRLHKADEFIQFAMPLPGDEQSERALPGIQGIMATGADLSTAYRIFEHALIHHFDPPEPVSAQEFFGDWQQAVAYAGLCLNKWRYRDGEDAFADWHDSEFEPRNYEPAERQESDDSELSDSPTAAETIPTVENGK